MRNELLREVMGKSVDEMLLRELVRPVFEVIFQCRKCHNTRPMDAMTLIHKFGPDTKLETLRFRATCVLCKRRRSHAFLRPVHPHSPMGPMGSPGVRNTA